MHCICMYVYVYVQTWLLSMNERYSVMVCMYACCTWYSVMVCMYACCTWYSVMVCMYVCCTWYSVMVCMYVRMLHLVFCDGLHVALGIL